MNLLFKPDYGAGLTHVKIEFGTDVNSSSGTEPSIMRSADESEKAKLLNRTYGKELWYTEGVASTNIAKLAVQSNGSGLYNNIFDNMKITPVDGYKPTITRVDDHDPSIIYNGDWYRTVPDSYLNFNRTISRAEISEEDTAEKSFEFSFTGDRFAIIGQTDPADIEVYIDGELFETKKNPWGALARQCSYSAEVTEGEHTVKIKVIGGSYTVDAI